MKIQKKLEALPVRPQYTEKKPFFSPKEIILRGERRAMVFRISPRMQMFMLLAFVFACGFSFYSYHMYHRSDKIISTQNVQLGKSYAAYTNLMTEFVALNKNVNTILSSLSKTNANKQELQKYQQQAALISDKIAQITKDNTWLSEESIDERAQLYDTMLQRDIVASERDELKRQLAELSDDVAEMRQVEMEVFKKIEGLSSKEVNKMKKALNEVNQSLKEKGLYFNALSHKKSNSGGPYIPAANILNKDTELNDKVSAIFENMEDIDYYKQVIEKTPIGKPVWSYWVTSKFGIRLDPFKKSKATHKGIDLASMSGNKIRTQAKGRVTRADANAGGYGMLIEIDHGNGFKTKYAHMQKMYVQKGDEVEANEAIGEVGSTGRSTGPHLHYEILYRGVPVDPMPFMQAKL